MKFSWSEPGIAISALLHAAMLVFALVAFSNAGKFNDAQEATAVDTITSADFDKLMKGDRAAKEVAPDPKPKVDKVAQAETEKPSPPTPDAKLDVPTPPPPLKRIEDPGLSDLPTPVKEPTPPVPTPPERPDLPKPTPPVIPPPPPRPPEPAKPDTSKSEPRPTPAKAAAEPTAPPIPPERPDAEAIEPPLPKPGPRQPEPKAAPTPPPKPKLVERKEEPKPKPQPEVKLDQLAKLLDEKKLEELAAAPSKPPKPVTPQAAKPKSGDEESKPPRKFNVSDISKLLSHDDPQSTGSTGHVVNKLTSRGSSSSAPKMSPSMLDSLDQILVEQYKGCWTTIGISSQRNYTPLIEVAYNPDGSLRGEPTLVKPPSDPAFQSLADSALRAVRRCNPLRIPAQFAPYFDQWKGPRILRFDPEEMAG